MAVLVLHDEHYNVIKGVAEEIFRHWFPQKGNGRLFKISEQGLFETTVRKKKRFSVQYQVSDYAGLLMGIL